MPEDLRPTISYSTPCQFMRTRLSMLKNVSLRVSFSTNYGLIDIGAAKEEDRIWDTRHCRISPKVVHAMRLAPHSRLQTDYADSGSLWSLVQQETDMCVHLERQKFLEKASS